MVCKSSLVDWSSSFIVSSFSLVDWSFSYAVSTSVPADAPITTMSFLAITAPT